jgi:hypothetical protein
MAPMILFDDGTSRYRLGPRSAADREELAERDARWVLERWMAREPWRSQLRRYVAHELRVEARTDEALLDRMCVLASARGLSLVMLDRIGGRDPAANVHEPALEPVSERSLVDDDEAHEPEGTKSDWIRLMFINGFQTAIRHTPITFGCGKTLTTDGRGVIRYRLGEIDGSEITIDYSDDRPPVEWPVRLPEEAGEYTIRLSIWSVSAKDIQ